MDHYFDIRIPDGARPRRLVGATIGLLHRYLLATEGVGHIAVSLPAHAGTDPGPVIRLHGQRQVLADLTQALGTGVVEPVPAHARHRVVKRVQVHSGLERMRRRHMRRFKCDATTAAAQVSVARIRQSTAPRVQVDSTSTGQNFPLLLAHGPLRDRPVAGAFNSYGLSCGEATVPWF